MTRGGCLCGGVRFEIARAVGPFELCHCSRCRKASGSAFVPWLGVLREDFRLLQGEELIQRYEAPLRDKPPPYRASFCGRCGSPVPDPTWEGPWIEVHAGVLDDDPGRRPERHILVEAKSAWFTNVRQLRVDRSRRLGLSAPAAGKPASGHGRVAQW